MVDGVAPLTEVIVSLVSGVFEACVYILAANVKPWRYLLSRSFRTKVNAQYAQSHPFFKWWDLFWGTVVMLASISVVAGLVVLVRTPSSRAIDSSEHRRMLQQIERAIARKFIEQRSAN
jgi:hypothetical protein